jgi:integrase
MPSAWISRRPTKAGQPRYRVLFRVGGRESTPRYAGTFQRRDDAVKRRNWVIGELAAMRVPDLSALAEPESVPKFGELSTRWLASLVDLRVSSLTQYRSALARARLLDDRPVDQITAVDVAELVKALMEAGKARETIRKSVSAVAAVLDFADIQPNPARDRRVRLPQADTAEPEPPDARTVEAVARRLPVPYLVALAGLDLSGRRHNELVKAKTSEFDADKQRWLVRARVSKNKRPSWGVISDDMVDGTALIDVLTHLIRPPDADNTDPPLFEGITDARLRMAIKRACVAAGIPEFSPHDLRHRRISLLHRQGVDWARIGERVGQRDISTTADTYTHVLIDPREVDWSAHLARALSTEDASR